MAKKKSSKREYFLCIDNSGYLASLEQRKIYLTLPDKSAAAKGLLRVIDQSGEDYLYPAARFVAIKVPQQAHEAFAGVA
jgi:hypothetical protein